MPTQNIAIAMTRLHEIPTFLHQRLGMPPYRTPHHRGWAFFTQNDVIKPTDPKPPNKTHWTNVVLKTGERATGEIERYRIREYPNQPDDAGWKTDMKTIDVMETFEIWGNPDHCMRLEFKRTIVWRRWTERDRDSGIRAHRYCRPNDVIMSRITALPTNLDFPEQYATEPLPVDVSRYATHTNIHCHRAKIGDLIEIDLTEIVGDQ